MKPQAALTSCATVVRELVSDQSMAPQSHLKDQLSRLPALLATVQGELNAIVAENVRLKGLLEKQPHLAPLALRRDGGYYAESGDGPFCPRCYEQGRQSIRMSEQGQLLWDIARWRCGHCHRETGGRPFATKPD